MKRRDHGRIHRALVGEIHDGHREVVGHDARHPADAAGEGREGGEVGVTAYTISDPEEADDRARGDREGGHGRVDGAGAGRIHGVGLNSGEGGDVRGA